MHWSKVIPDWISTIESMECLFRNEQATLKRDCINIGCAYIRNWQNACFHLPKARPTRQKLEADGIEFANRTRPVCCGGSVAIRGRRLRLTRPRSRRGADNIDLHLDRSCQETGAAARASILRTETRGGEDGVNQTRGREENLQGQTDKGHMTCRTVIRPSL